MAGVADGAEEGGHKVGFRYATSGAAVILFCFELGLLSVIMIYPSVFRRFLVDC